MTDLNQRAKALGRVAVVYGGNSSEREVSLKSGAAVSAALLRAGTEIVEIDLFGADGQADPIAQLREANCDRAFLILHGPTGEDGVIQGALELLKIPYTGSGVGASALAMDKLRSKQVFIAAGLPTPEFAVLKNAQSLVQAAEQLGFPMILKPAHEGSSIGISKVENSEELEAAWSEAQRFDRCVIAERWMAGGEYTVAVLADQALPSIKLETEHAIYDYSAKYQSGDTRYIFDHDLTEAQCEQLANISLEAFEVLGCEGWARVDVMQDDKGDWFILEVNTAPGMTDHSLVPMAAARADISFEQLVVTIAEGAH